MSLLLDTNVLSELNKKIPESKVVTWFQTQKLSDCYLSVITIGEIEQGIEASRDAVKAASLSRWLEVPMTSATSRGWLEPFIFDLTR